QASRNYQVRLRLRRDVQRINSDGFFFASGRRNETALVFRTAGGGTAFGGAPALSLTAVGLPPDPAVLIQPGDWIRFPVTGSNSGGNAVGTSDGAAVPIQFEVVLNTTKTWGAGNIILAQGFPG